jgi:uncharacterized repeat protein (TIGR01451 family)
MNNKGTLIGIAALAALATSHAGVAAAQSEAVAAQAAQGCISLKTVAETEQEIVNEKGERSKRLVPAARVTPGAEVVWTVTASNVCAQSVGNVFINNPVPEHMRYVADSALGVGAEIAYSLDGRRFGSPDTLRVRDADGNERLARADEYRHIRWTFRNAIAPGQLVMARFRAVLK